MTEEHPDLRRDAADHRDLNAGGASRVHPSPSDARRVDPRAAFAWALVALGLALGVVRLVFPQVPPSLLTLPAGGLAVLVMVTVSVRDGGRWRATGLLIACSIAVGTTAMTFFATSAQRPQHEALDTVSYLFAVAGTVTFVRRMSRSDPDAWLDALTVGVFLALAMLEFVIDPNGTVVPNPGGGVFSLVLSIVVDVLVLTAVARLVIRPMASRSITFLGLIVALVILVDAAYNAGGPNQDGARPVYEAAWCLAYLAWAAIAVHPDFRLLVGRPQEGPVDPLGMRGGNRTLAVHLAALGASAALFAYHFANDQGASALIFVVGIIVQFGLTGIRGVRFVRRMSETARLRFAAEEALRRSESRFRELARMAPVGIVLADASGASQFQNEAWGITSGQVPGTVSREDYGATIHPDDTGRAVEAWRQSIATGEPMDLEYRYLHTDGTVRWVQAKAAPLGDAAGARYGWVGTVADITGLVESRERAERRERFIIALIEQSPIGIALYGANGSPLQVNDAERRIRRAAGVLADVRDARKDPLLGALGQRDAILRAYAGEGSDGDGVPVRVPAVGPVAGRETWVRMRWFPMREADGAVVAVISFAEDVTTTVRAAAERERVETRLREAAKLEALGVLAGGIAHDFNNLLVAILGHAELARAEVPDDSDAARDMEAVEVAAGRAADLARQMLAYSGRGSFVVGPVRLDTLVREIGDLLHRSIAKSATLEYDFAPDLPPVIADATQLRQLVLNLIVNASDALEGRPGRIHLRTGWIDLAADAQGVVPGTETAPGRYVMLEVTDTGHGMDEATVNRIFDPFFSTKAAGRGLGLAATIGIVKGHGGAIRVESAPGTGTRFEVLLRPTGEAHDGGSPAGAAGSGSGWIRPEPGSRPVRQRAFDDSRAGKHILIVDDEATVRLIGRRILEKAGYVVSEAVDGPEGLEAYETDPHGVDAVLLDLTLPTMDGTQVLDRMREVRPALPVVICSGWAAEEVADRLDTDHITQFVQKPYMSDVLLEAIAMVLEAGAD
ncbi:MAG: response regulator [Chloroflexota bacterium]